MTPAGDKGENTMTGEEQPTAEWRQATMAESA